MAVTGDVFNGVFCAVPFSPREILDETLIESVSEGFPTYSEFTFCFISVIAGHFGIIYVHVSF